MREKISNLREKMIKKLQSRAARAKMDRAAAAAGPNRTRERVEVRFHRSFFLRVWSFCVSSSFISLSFSEQRAFFLRQRTKFAAAMKRKSARVDSRR